MGSCRVIEFTRVRPEGHWVHPESFGSFGCAVGVVGFICFPFGVVGFIRGRWVYSGSHWVTLGLSGVVGFTRCVSWASLCSSGVIGFSRVRPRGRWVHPGSLGYLGFDMGSSGVVEFTRIRPEGR